MPKKKKLLLSIVAMCLIISVMTIVALSNQSSGVTQGNPEQTETGETEPTDDPEGPLFVVPENTLGTIGLISALMIGFGVFAIKNKKIKLY
jgi:hypothetical protein